MTKATRVTEILGVIRRYPGLYKLLVWLRKRGGFLLTEFMRAASPRACSFGPPKGIYSELELVEQGTVSGEIIARGQEVPEFGPDSLVKRCKLGQDGHQPWPIFWSLNHNVRLIGPTLVNLNKDKQACVEAMYGPEYYRLDRSYKHITRGPVLKLKGNWTSLLDEWSLRGYWHFLMDGLPRLALLDRFPKDTQILVPPNSPWRIEFLEMLGLKGRFRPTQEKHLEIENYYFSAPTSMTGCYNPHAIQFLRNSFLGMADSGYSGPRRFYITRDDSWTRGVINDPEVRKVFSSRGWGLIPPEKLTVLQQIQLFRNAEAVCGLHGSALTNLVWASPGCHVLELCPANFYAGAFEWVAKALSLPHNYLLCEGDSLFRARVDIPALEQKLDLLDESLKIRLQV